VVLLDALGRSDDEPRPTGLSTADGSLSATDCSNLLVTCEAKFRSHLTDSHVLYDDPIRNYGEPGTSHCHDFFGNDATNAFSTYSTLRTKNEPRQRRSLNATGYWSPCLIKTNPFRRRQELRVKMPVAALYYVTDNSMSQWLTPLPFGLRYVGGTNMDDPENTKRKRSMLSSPMRRLQVGPLHGYGGDGFNGIQCLADQQEAGA
jgi:hypothetical protein